MIKNVASIRGGLGMQILEYLALQYMVYNTNKKIDEIYISIGYNENVIDEMVSVNWLEKLFIVESSILFADSWGKQGIWSRPDFFKSMASSVEEIRPKLKSEIFAHDRPLMHVRSGDGFTATIERFVSLGRKIGQDLVIVGNDHHTNTEIINQLGFGEDISQDPVNDWRAIVGAPILGAPFSSFSVSAMLFDVNKEYYFLYPSINQNKEIKDTEKQIMKYLIDSVFKNGAII